MVTPLLLIASHHTIVSPNIINHPRSKIIVTSRRPPPTPWIDPRVEFVAVDFLESVETIISKIKDICSPVTHAYFTSYVHDDDFRVLREKNVPLFRNFLDAVDAVCPALRRVSLQTGGKVCFLYVMVFFGGEWKEL